MVARNDDVADRGRLVGNNTVKLHNRSERLTCGGKENSFSSIVYDFHQHQVEYVGQYSNCHPRNRFTAFDSADWSSIKQTRNDDSSMA